MTATRTEPRRSNVNLPNALAALRLALSPAMLVPAALGWTGTVVALFAVLLLTDWIDGKLARRWRQRTAMGARLDTFADVVLYSSLLGAIALLRPGLIERELAWCLAAAASYALSVAVCLARFRQWPSYHTRLAKTCWLLVGIAAIVALADGPRWPIHLAAAVVTLTNLEAAAISLALPAPRSDVPSLYHAWLWRDTVMSDGGQAGRAMSRPRGVDDPTTRREK